MRKFIRRAVSGVLLAALMLTSASGSVAMAEEMIPVAHDHGQEGEETLLIAPRPSEEKVLVVTADMLDEKGVATIAEGSWDRIVIARNCNAKKVTLKDVTAAVLVIESGTDCAFEISSSVITDVKVMAPTLEVIDYKKICEMLEAGISATEVVTAYQNYRNAKEAAEGAVPAITVDEASEITSMTVAGNARLNLTAAKVAEVKINGDGTQDKMKVVVEGYKGIVTVDQKNLENGVNNILNLSLKGSELEALNIAGEEKTICYVEGTKAANVNTVNVSGASQVTMNVDAEEVTVDEKAEKASLRIYSDVANVVVKGDNNEVSMAASAKVDNAKVEGDNVKVSNSGTIGNSEITGSGSSVSYVPAVTATPRPTATPKPVPTEAPVTPVPEPTEAPVTPGPEVTVVPEPTMAPEVHTHKWNVEAATCVTAKKCETCGYVEEAATGIHDFKAEGVVTAATCEQGGYTTYTCKYCTETKTDDVTAPTGHSVTEWTIGTAVEGKKCTYTQTGKCTVCGKTQTSDTNVVKHSDDLKVKITEEATCKAAGTKVYYCGVEGCDAEISTESYENAEAHKWDEGATDGGKTVYTCSVCGKTKFVVTMTTQGVSGSALTATTQVALENDVVMSMDDSVLQQINGDETGTSSGAALKLSASTLDTSARDEATKQLSDEQKAQLGSNDIYDFAMSVNGKTLTNFDGSVTVSVPYELAPGEDPDAVIVWYLSDLGTVEEITGKYHNGLVTFTTSHFSYYTVVRMTPEARCKLFGHLWLSATTNPTCTEDGYITSICQRCAETKVEKGAEATGHNITVTVVEEATCQHKGKHRQECNNKHCEYYTEVETPKADHKLKEKKDGRLEPTCTQDGYVEYECKDKGCSHSKKEIIPALGHQKDKDGRCKYCGMDMTCKHTNAFTMVKLAEGAATCLDGVISWEYCPDCNSTIEEFDVVNGHIPGALEYLILGDSAGAVILKGCACGESEGCVERHHSHDNWNWINSGWKDEQDVMHEQAVQICNTCGLQIMAEWYDTDVNSCVVTRHETVTVWNAKDELVGQMKVDYHCMNHLCVNKVTLAEGSKNCLDGVEWTEYCIRCNAELGTEAGKIHANGLVDYIDLSKYTDCGGYLLYTKCVCGENGFVNDWAAGCNFEWTNGGDEVRDGILYTFQERTCRNCGLVVTEESTIARKADCTAHWDSVWKVSVDGEVVETMEASFKNEYHDIREKAALTEGSVSCLDGVQIVNVCVDCGQEFGDWMEYDHYQVGRERIDLSDYDTCGGEVNLRGCACGEDMWVEYPYDEHDLIWNYDWVADDNGMETEVEFVTCRNCSFEMERRRTVAKNADCTAVVSYEYKIYVGETLLDTWTYTVADSAHDSYIAEVILKNEGTSCEEGCVITEKCHICDWTNIWEDSGWHPQVETAIDLSEYGVACGGTLVFYECPCGLAVDSDIDLKCDTGYSWDEMFWDNYELVSEDGDTRVFRSEYNCAVTEPKCTLHIVMEQYEVRTNECGGEGTVYLNGDTNGDGIYEFTVKIGDYGWSSHSELGVAEVTYSEENGVKLKTETRYCTGCGEWEEVEVYADYLGDESYRYTVHKEWGDGGWMEYEDWDYTFTADSCSYVRTRSNDGGNYEVFDAEPACIEGTWISDRTCTDYAYGVCAKCGKENPLHAEIYGEPMGHDFQENGNGNGYTCTRCGLENENGASGSIVLEDISDEENYIASYWNKEGLVYDIYVFLVTADEDVMTDLAVTDSGESFENGRASLSKAAAEVWAKENGVTEAYDVMFSFIPKNASVDTSFNIIFAEAHNWIYKTELLTGSASCSDGILVTEYCLDCGKNGKSWTEYGHLPEAVAVFDLSAAETSCGGYIVVQQCICGVTSYVDVDNYTLCDFSFVNWSYSEETGLATEEYVCNKCGIQLLDVYSDTKQENCQALRKGTLELYENGTKVAFFDYERLVESHEGRDWMELLEGAESCEDGVQVYYICSNCGIIMDEYTINEHREMEVGRVNSPSEETCGEVFRFFQCACGKESHFGFPDNWDFERRDETFIDENGVEHRSEIYSCTSCDANVRNVYTVTPDGNCTAQVKGDHGIFVGDTQIGNYSYEKDAQEYHVCRDSFKLAEGAESCEDGVYVTYACVDCGLVRDEYTINEHRKMEVGRTDTSSVEGACGGVFRFMECACGQEGELEYPEGKNFQVSFGEFVDDAGLIHKVFTHQCEDCSVYVTEDKIYNDLGDCRAKVEVTHSIFAGTTPLCDYYNEYMEEFHDIYVESATLLTPGTSCKDGVAITMKCYDCDWTHSQTEYDHNQAVIEALELSEHGSSCGGRYSHVACACGESENVDKAVGCVLSQTEKFVQSEDGLFHWIVTGVCENCGISYTMDQYAAPGENCTGTEYTTYTFCNGDTQIGEFSWERQVPKHDMYISEGTLANEGTSCEQGVTYVWKCRDCEYSEIEESTEHKTGVVVSNVLPEDCCSSVTKNACPCGMYNYDLNWNCTISHEDMSTNGYGDVESTEEGEVAYATHTCSTCGHTFEFKRVEVPTDETSGEGDVYLIIDEEEFCVLSYSYSGE